MMSLTLLLLPQDLSIVRFPPTAMIPQQIWNSAFVAIVKSEEELSIVCDTQILIALEGVREDLIATGWQGLKVVGPLEFSLTGILASLTTPLAAAQISIFAISSYDTDYILVGESQLTRAIQVLTEAGHEVQEMGL